MIWKVEYLASVKKDVKKLDVQTRLRIKNFIEDSIATSKDLRELGRALKGEKFGEFWRYRLDDYRILCKITDNKLTIMVVKIGYRKDVYK